MPNSQLSPQETKELLNTLKERFEKNMNRHQNLEWADIQSKLEENFTKMWSVSEMERTGGEPDVVVFEKSSKEIFFVDCSEQTPKGRRSLCYDRQAWNARKEYKPANSALDIASEMGTELLTEEEYRLLQEFGEFDTKTSSWIVTPAEIRKLGGALYCDRRYDHVFTYHNGAESYYAVRGFRAKLKV